MVATSKILDFFDMLRELGLRCPIRDRIKLHAAFQVGAATDDSSRRCAHGGVCVNFLKIAFYPRGTPCESIP
jgi:hypothetical protein